MDRAGAHRGRPRGGLPRAGRTSLSDEDVDRPATASIRARHDETQTARPDRQHRRPGRNGGVAGHLRALRCRRGRLMPARFGRWRGAEDDVGARCGIGFADLSHRRDAKAGNCRRWRRAPERVHSESTFRVGGARNPDSAGPDRDPARRAGGWFRRGSESGLDQFADFCMRFNVRIVAEVLHAIVSHNPCGFGFRCPPKEAWHAGRRSRVAIGLSRAVVGRGALPRPRCSDAARTAAVTVVTNATPDPGGTRRRVPQGDAGRAERGAERFPSAECAVRGS